MDQQQPQGETTPTQPAGPGPLAMELSPGLTCRKFIHTHSMWPLKDSSVQGLKRCLMGGTQPILSPQN